MVHGTHRRPRHSRDTFDNTCVVGRMRDCRRQTMKIDAEEFFLRASADIVVEDKMGRNVLHNALLQSCVLNPVGPQDVACKYHRRA